MRHYIEHFMGIMLKVYARMEKKCGLVLTELTGLR